MSDFEDEMEMDEPIVREEITFSSNNASSKGKRSAANLPVELEDSLPWWAQSKSLIALCWLMDALQGREISSEYP